MSTPEFAKRPLTPTAFGTFILDPAYLNTTIVLEPNDHGDDEEALEAFIQTPRLMLFSVGHSKRRLNSDLKTLIDYYGAPDNMSLYGAGHTLSSDHVSTKHQDHIDRWLAGNVFSSFMIDTEDGTTIGETIFGESDDPGMSECAVIIDGKYQKKGYGTEAVVTQSYFWAPLIAEKYKVNDCELTALTATAHPENGTSKLFPRAGYELVKRFEHKAYGAERNYYMLSIATAERRVSESRTHYSIK